MGYLMRLTHGKARLAAVTRTNGFLSLFKHHQYYSTTALNANWEVELSSVFGCFSFSFSVTNFSQWSLPWFVLATAITNDTGSPNNFLMIP